jgi:SH3-like domain-containing protein
VKSSPNPDGKELFIVHEGVKVRIKNAQSQWYEVELEDGSVGWVPQQMAERI